MPLIDKLLIVLVGTFLGMVFVLLQTYEFIKPIIDTILTVTAVISFVLALHEFFRKK